MSQSSYNNNNLSFALGLSGLLVVGSTVFQDEISQVKEAASQVFAVAAGSHTPAVLTVISPKPASAVAVAPK